MKIERLIQIFEQLLPIYEKGYIEKYSRFFLYKNNLDFGLCCTVFYTEEINDKDEFFLYLETATTLIWKKQMAICFQNHQIGKTSNKNRLYKIRN